MESKIMILRKDSMLYEIDDGFLRQVFSTDKVSFHINIVLIVTTVQSGEQNTHTVSDYVCGTPNREHMNFGTIVWKDLFMGRSGGKNIIKENIHLQILKLLPFAQTEDTKREK
jgi:hypothetical protein